MARLIAQLLNGEFPREGEGTGGGGAGAGGAGSGAGAGDGAGGAGAGAGGGAGAGSGAGAGAGEGAGAGAGGGDPWYKPLNLEPKAAEWIEGHKFADPAAVIKSAMHFEGLARGKNVLPAPDPEKPGEWEGWEKLGWESDPAKYTFEAPKDLPAGMEWDQGMEDSLRKLAHENHVPLATARVLRDALLTHQKQQFEALTGKGAAAEKDLETKLRTDWGQDYERNRELAKRAAQALGVGETEAGELEDLMGSPRLVQLFHKAGDLIGEQALPALTGGGNGLPSNVAGVRAELNRLQGDAEFMKALRDPRHARNKEVTAQRQRLIDQIARLEAA